MIWPIKLKCGDQFFVDLYFLYGLQTCHFFKFAIYITYFPIKNFSPCRTFYTASSIERSGATGAAPNLARRRRRRRPPRLLHKRFSRPAASCLVCRCATLLFHPYRQGQWGSNELFALYPAGKKYSKIFSFAFWHIQWPFFFGIHSKPINIRY